jgi:hypothetical protein
VPEAPAAVGACLVRGQAKQPGLIIRLIIQTIRRDPSRSAWIDDAPNVSRLDPSGADQSDAARQAMDLVVGPRSSDLDCGPVRSSARPARKRSRLDAPGDEQALASPSGHEDAVEVARDRPRAVRRVGEHRVGDCPDRIVGNDLTGVSLRGARANAFTDWPDGFDWRQAGVIMDDEPAS